MTRCARATIISFSLFCDSFPLPAESIRIHFCLDIIASLLGLNVSHDGPVYSLKFASHYAHWEDVVDFYVVGSFWQPQKRYVSFLWERNSLYYDCSMILISR